MILYEYSYLRVYPKILNFSFSTYLTPLAYAIHKTRPPDTNACKIWALNSQYYVFVTQTRVCAQHTNFGVFAQTRVGIANT